ncbi:MAG: hypothetical protein EPO27_04295 [Betaproteobacteria bacterium]|nr:MAG: hypothetical protein EPO27_04295 [Betaproteobacteria bacterium]
MISTRIAIASLLAAALAAPALAQPGPGKAGPRFRFNQDNVPGWTMMSQVERDAHRDRMFSFKTYDECKAYQEEHHKAMQARATEKGKTLGGPRYNACDRMKARGLIK